MHYLKQLSKETISFAAKTIVVFGMGVLFVLIAAGVWISTERETDSENQRTIMVEGTAEAKIAPDSARITVGKTLRGRDAATLQTDASETINDLLAELEKIGIAEEQIRTNNYSVTPEYNSRGNDFEEIDSYQIDISVVVTLENTDPEDETVSKVLAAAKKVGANEVRGLNFFIADEDAVREELEDEAIAEAKRKADRRAKETGLKLDRVIDISFDRPYYYAFNRSSNVAESYELSADESAPVEPELQISRGQFDIETTVTLEYIVK